MKYGEQLEERTNFIMAANYYMMSGDFNRVINMFKANNLMKYVQFILSLRVRYVGSCIPRKKDFLEQSSI